MLHKNPHIAVFSLAYSPFEGGAEIAARETIKRLKGLNFTIFTYKFDRNWLSKEKRDNSEIIRLGRGENIRNKKAKKQNSTRTGLYYGRIWNKVSYIFSAWRKVEELHKHKRFELIWAIMASYGAIAALFFKLNHPRIPLLLTIQEGDSEKHLVFGKFGLVGLLGGKVIKRADHIQVISTYLRDFVKKRGAQSPISIIPNGVDIDLFSTKYTNFEIKAARDNLGIKDDYVIVTTSRLVRKNGIDILIDAISKFREKRQNIKCLIIGGGPERKKLELKAKRLKLEANIIFLGQIKQKDLPLYLKISDIFVRPSRSEGLGSSFLEAMAAGVPVIGTPVGGIVDFLQNDQTGFYMRVDDSQSLAEKIDYVLKNAELSKRVIHNAKSLINENYSWEVISRMFKNLFDQLINL